MSFTLLSNCLELTGPGISSSFGRPDPFVNSGPHVGLELISLASPGTVGRAKWHCPRGAATMFALQCLNPRRTVEEFGCVVEPAGHSREVKFPSSNQHDPW